MERQAHTPASRPAPMRRARKGFTLIELLVVVTIIALLISIVLPALAGARVAARTVRDQKSAAQLITAYHLYSTDARGLLMPGYATSAMTAPGGSTAGKLTVVDETGAAVTGVVARRYPWRIAPYMDYNFLGLYEPKILERYKSRPDFQYVVSLSPAMGLNADFLGGKSEPGLGFNASALATYGSFYLTRMDQARHPDKLIVFGTSRGVDPDGGTMPGFYDIASPRFTVERWTAGAFNPATDPDAFGFIDLRCGGKAVTGQLDGHADVLGMEDLRDMRRWSGWADRPDWMLTPR